MNIMSISHICIKGMLHNVQCLSEPTLYLKDPQIKDDTIYPELLTVGVFFLLEQVARMVVSQRQKEPLR